MTYNSSKANRWCINHNHKYFLGNQSSKSAPFIGSLQAKLYLTNASNTLITVVRIINFTVVHCVYIIVLLYLFCYKPVFIPLLTKDRDMHAYVHSWLPNDDDRNSKTTNFWACFFYAAGTHLIS